MTCYTRVSRSSPTYAAIVASVVAHVLLFAGLAAVDTGEPEPEDDSFVVEIDVAPAAPEATDRLSSLEDEPVDQADVVAAVEPEPEPVIDPEAIAIDAGVPIDAAPIDAPRQLAAVDAGPTDAGGDPDAGTAIASSGIDAGATTDAGPGDNTGDATPTGPVGVGVDLGFAAPSGDHLAVLLRFDRIRGSIWHQPAEEILEPMPDYRMIIGDRAVSIASRLDMLMISSSDPRDVTATNLAGKTPGSAADLRSFLDHPKSPVTWTQAHGGALGSIQSPQFTTSADQRVYLAPMAGWIVLADRKHLGALAQPAGAELGTLPAKGSLPPWMQRLPRLIGVTGTGSTIDDGPAVALSVRGLPDEIEIPMVGKLTAPEHMTAALQIHKLGFIVRGTMEFESAEQAAAFIDKVSRTRASLLASPVTAAPLRRFHAYHAVNGLTLKPIGSRVSYATSISVPDARAMMKLAASQTTRWYLRRRAGE